MPGPSIVTFDGNSGQPLGRWKNVGTLELAWDMIGSATARLSAPSSEPWWDKRRAFPGWIGALVQVDCRDRGLPLWTGRLTAPQPSSDSGEVAAQLTGPQNWLERYHLPVGNDVREPLGRVAYRSLAVHPTWPLVTMKLAGTHLGPSLSESLVGKSVWELLQSAIEFGEWPRLEPVWGTPHHELRWLSQLRGDDRSGNLVFENGRNATFDVVPDLQGAIEQLTIVAQSLGLGNKQRGASGRARPAAPFGRKAALGAVVNGAIFARLSGESRSTPRVSATSMDSASAYLEQQLRQLCTMAIPAQIVVTDSDLWPMIRPGVIATTSWPQDPHGVFRRARVQVETVTASPETGEMNLSCVLWDQEG